MARLVPLAPDTARAGRTLGCLAGRMPVPEAFDAPPPDALLDAFEGG